ncbi:MAG TPA: DUF488 domain-containing protein [Steroidobacteraceae bacterium]|nr:DUF488 domain-containing protein [Steroidobacteraceae bacterium]
MPRLHILTIGYEGTSLTDFIATLKAHRVRQVLDVRELAISRRRGFSKTALSLALAGAGISYAHGPALGTPRWLRHRLRDDGDFDGFRKDFRKQLAAKRPLLDSLAGSLSGRVALLCYERNPSECHRSLVAAALARRTRAAVEHLEAPAI